MDSTLFFCNPDPAERERDPYSYETDPGSK
jgi:hypothetical protein